MLLTTLLFCLQGVLGNEHHIKSASELIQFSQNVNSGTSYNDTTVFLDNEIDFSGGLSEQFEPIGNNWSSYFQGTFDGQGYVISNLAINFSVYTGLFGYSKEATIRNVVLDSSCSVNAHTSSSLIGGIIGSCSDCIIESNVNMADISFIGYGVHYLHIGGIIGSLCVYSKEEVTVKNCANYGSVTCSGRILNGAYIGGISGESDGYYSTDKVFIQNCLNYGAIIHNGTTSRNLYIGGIIGEVSVDTSIVNCVSAGAITSKTSGDIGSIAGDASHETILTHCYWTSDITYNKAYGNGHPEVIESTSFNSATFELNETVSFGNYTGTSLIDALNAAADYYYLRGYSNWLLNKDSKDISFTTNNRTKPLTLNTQLILLPSLANEGNMWFDGWYTDSSCTVPLTDSEIITDTKLSGKWEENINYYTIIFDTRGGAPVEPITAQFETTVTLPNNSLKSYCSVGFWETDYGDKVSFNFTVPAHNTSLHAVWLCTRITTVEDIFDFSKIVNSGDSCSGTTVFLDVDVDFSGFSQQFEPICRDYSFKGTFDGQGYTINNLAINSSSWYTGLFGDSSDATIRNVVVDSSCSAVYSYAGRYEEFRAGWIAGYCHRCTIENNVNMASISIIGRSTHWRLYLGGIVGYLYSSSTVKNCANYGSVIVSATKRYAYIGGVVGYFFSGDSRYINCVNQGEIIVSGMTLESFCIGGIVGVAGMAKVSLDNCVSAGTIIVANKTNSYIGSVIGWSDPDFKTTITHCYWTSDAGNFNVSGYVNYTVDIETSLATLNKTIVNNLNSYNSTWNKWLLNTNSKPVTFKINNGKGFTLSSQLILLPSLSESEGHTFSGWFEDKERFTKFSKSSIEDATTLYGLYGISATVTFDFGNGTVVNETLHYNQTINYPNPTREGWTFNGWNPRPERMPANDFTVTAQWTETVTDLVEIVFDTKDMTEKDVEDLVKKVTDGEFKIVGFEEDKDTGETKVSIKFKDESTAKGFVEAIRDSSDSDKLKLKTIGFIKEAPRSSANAAGVVSFFIALGLTVLF